MDGNLFLITLSNASATLWFIRAEQTAEGEQLRRYYKLELLRQENPVFALTWTLFHVIDQTSPLFGLSAKDLASADAVLVLTVSGIGRQLRERAAGTEGLLPRRHCLATSIR